MILLMLNAAMYLAEVVNVQWDEIKDGCLVTHRAKTGKCVRVAVLWPETLEALKKVRHRGPFVFYNYACEPLGIKGAEKRFRDLRDAAKVRVTSSQLRDGAYTAAVEANVTSNLCQLLVGHRSGLADHYVNASPRWSHLRATLSIVCISTRTNRGSRVTDKADPSRVGLLVSIVKAVASFSDPWRLEFPDCTNVPAR